VNANELWNDVNSMEDFIGRWEASFIVPMSLNQGQSIPESSIEVTISLEYIKGSEEADFMLSYDFDRYLTDLLEVEEIKATMITKDILWGLLMGEVEKEGTFKIGGKYYIYTVLPFNENDISSSPSGDKFMINENGDKLKMVFSRNISFFGDGYPEFNEIILTKR
jgi:hypothetical protein